MSGMDTAGLRLLSLDGGGIRGLSTLLILETIMHRIKAEEGLKNTPHPCDYFDLIGGTSTGGIIALMLGRLRMSVEDAIDCYDDLAGRVFSKSNWLGDGKYKAELLEDVIKEIVMERTGDSETQVLDDGALDGVCKTFVCAMSAHTMNARIPVLFRTYESPKETSISCTVWQAARATSAAPTFFKRVFIGPAARPEQFIDGVGRNNPTEQVLEEVESMFPDRKIACVISIGTGKPGTIDVPNPGFFERNVVPVGVIKAVVAMAVDCEETAQQMEKKFKHVPKIYFRFNVEQGLQKVKFGDWERMGEVAAHTRNYMNTQEVSQCLATAVEAIRERKGVIKTSAINSIQIQNEDIHEGGNSATIERMNEILENEERRKIMAWVSSIDVSAQHFAVASAREPETGEWLLNSNAFQEWKIGSGQALWYHGMPGVGKTFLVSLIIDHLRALNEPVGTIAVAWFYFNYKEVDKQTSDAIHLSLIRQLAGFDIQLYALLKSWYKDPISKSCPPAGRLIPDMRLLTREFTKVFIVVDALDECAENERNRLLEILAQLQTFEANVLITSRDHVYDNNSKLVRVQRISIQGLKDDITKFTNARLDNQNRLAQIIRTRPFLREKIVTTIVDSCQGMFLMATLHLEALGGNYNAGEVLETLSVLPKTVPGIYDDAMKRIESDNSSKFALRILSFLVYARRQLTLVELQHFLAVRPGHTDFHDEYITDGDILLSVCAGLVVIDDTTGVVRLVHFTAQEYFDNIRASKFSEADLEMGRAGLIYLSFNAFRMDSYHSKSSLSCHALLKYITNYWHLHISNHQDTLRIPLTAFFKDEALLHAYSYFMRTYSSPKYMSISTFTVIYRSNHSHRHTGLHAAATGGLQLMVGWLIADDANANFQDRINSQDQTGRTALIYGSLGGHEKVVDLLISKGADINVRDNGYYNKTAEGNAALQVASRWGHEAVVKLLLENGADINLQSKWVKSALQVASEEGHEAVVKLLLENGAMNAGSEMHGSPLMLASENDHKAVVKLLLENGADVNGKGEPFGLSALSTASRGGHKAMVKFLLENGADINGGDYAALMAASERGHEAVVKFLLENGAYINAENMYMGTALMAASNEGHEVVVKLLLENGAFINAENKYMSTALMVASERGHEAVVKFLLENGAYINAENENKGTALMVASERGHESVVKLLLENDADVNARVGRYTSALIAASYRGHETVAKLLLENRADINVNDGWHGTALMAASGEGNEAVVKLLLDNGADKDDSNFGTALNEGNQKKSRTQAM